MQRVNARGEFNDLRKNSFKLLTLPPSMFNGDTLAKFELKSVKTSQAIDYIDKTVKFDIIIT